MAAPYSRLPGIELRLPRAATLSPALPVSSRRYRPHSDARFWRVSLVELVGRLGLLHGAALRDAPSTLLNGGVHAAPLAGSTALHPILTLHLLAGNAVVVCVQPVMIDADNLGAVAAVGVAAEAVLVDGLLASCRRT